MKKPQILACIRDNPDLTPKQVAKPFGVTPTYVARLAKDHDLTLKRGPNKYNNRRVQVAGIWFDSGREAKRYLVLKLLLTQGKITHLRLQPKYPLHAPNGTKVGTYVADFDYLENGQLVVEDAKGKETGLFRHKRRHFEAEYGITLTLV